MNKIKLIGVVILLMLWLPIEVFGEGKSDYTLTFDSNTQSITGYEGDVSKTVIIPNKINGVEVKAINASAFTSLNINCLKLPYSIEEIILLNNSTVEATEENLYKYVVYSFVEINYHTGELYGNFYFDKAEQRITGYDNINGPKDVVIPSKIDGIEVKYIDSYAFNDLYLTSVTIPETIKTISYYAFAQNDLTTLTIPKNVDAIYDNAFRDNNLTKLNIENPTLKLYSYAFFENDLSKVAFPKTIGIYNNAKQYEVTEYSLKYFHIIDIDTTVEFYEGEKIGDFYFDRATKTIIGYSPNGPKDVVIPSVLDGVEVKKIGDYAFTEKDIKSLKIEEGITEIGEYAFHLNSISNITLPKSLTVINEGAFYGAGLYSITLPSNLTKIGEEAFAQNNFKNINIPATVKKIEAYAFRDNSLTSVTLNSGLESIGWGAFQYNEIETIDIPNTVKEIEANAFKSNQLRIIILPPSVRKIGAYAFVDNAYFETNAEIGNTLEYIYAKDDSGEYNYIPATLEDLIYYEVFDEFADINFYKEPKFGDFYFDKSTGTVTGYGLTGSKDVVIPDKIDGVDVKILGNELFANRDISTVLIPDTVEIIGDDCFFDNKLESVDLPSNLKEIGNYAFHYNSIENLEIPFGVTNIGRYAFYDNGMKTLKLPNSIKNISSGAFCYNQLTDVEIPYSLELIGDYAFESNKIKRVELPTSLKAITVIDSEYTELEPTVENLHRTLVFDELCEIVFYENFKFGDLYFDKETGTITGYSEEGGKEVVIPSDIEGVKVSNIGEYAFKDRGITKLELPDTIEVIGIEAFSSNNIKELVLPDSVKTLGNGAFKNNELESLEFSSNLVEISDNAFADNNLTTIIIPEGVTYIGISAFENNKLANVEIPNTVTEIGVRAFYSNNLREIKLPKSVVYIVSYLGDSEEKEKYELTDELLIELKVFDEDVDIKTGVQLGLVFITIGIVGLITLVCIVVGFVVVKGKNSKVVDVVEDIESNINDRHSN